MKIHINHIKVTKLGACGRASVLCILFFLIAAWRCEAVVYVNGTSPGGNGTTWSQAYRTIEEALSKSSAGAEIWIAAGVYRPAGPLRPKANMRLYGGFSGSESQLNGRNPTANKVIIDGRGVLNHILEIRQDAPGVRLDGLTVANGRAVLASSFSASGAALIVLAANAVIESCSFENNIANGLAGAVLVQGQEGASNVRIINCRFSGNQSSMGGALGLNQASDAIVSGCTFLSNRVVVSATEAYPRGGAIWVAGRTATIQNSIFDSNQAPHMGGAIDATFARVVIEESSFVGNAAGVAGGGIALNQSTGVVSMTTFIGNSAELDNGGGLFCLSSPVDVADSLFFANQARYGGGMQLDYSLSGRTDVITRTRFIGNYATSEGGGLHTYARTIRLENSVFSGNIAPVGGGMRTHGGEGGDFDSSMTVTLNHCVLYDNWSDTRGGAMFNSFVPEVHIYNSILWSNDCADTNWDPWTGSYIKTKDIFNAGSGRIVSRYTIMETLNWNHFATSESHQSGLSSSPLFLQPTGPDGVMGTTDDQFHLRSNSPAIDRADGNIATGIDILGKARVDFPGIPNSGVGSPNFADIGAYERYSAAETPVAQPAPGRYSGRISVQLTSSTPGAIIRYTLDNTSPTSSSPSGSVVTLSSNATLRARAFAFDYQPSQEFVGNYTLSGGGKVARADFDGDGRSDFGYYHPLTGSWSLMQSRDGALGTSFGYQGTISFVGDFDGDGKADFGCYDPVGIPGAASPGSWYIMQSRAGFRTQTFGYAGTIPFVGDFDGDGLADYGCYDPAGIPGLASPGSWYIMQSRAGFRTQTFGYRGTIPFVGDFDGDGLADYGCYDPAGIPGLASPGSWYIMQSKKGFRTETFGYAGTVPIVGDFDGDGVTDFGCYDPVGIPGLASPGSWYIMQSQKGFRTETFGYAGTVPVVGDYDGDGTDDFGCYDANGIPGAAAPGSWYIMQSRDGFRIETLGFPGTEPVGK